MGLQASNTTKLLSHGGRERPSGTKEQESSRVTPPPHTHTLISCKAIFICGRENPPIKKSPSGNCLQDRESTGTLHKHKGGPELCLSRQGGCWSPQKKLMTLRPKEPHARELTCDRTRAMTYKGHINQQHRHTG